MRKLLIALIGVLLVIMVVGTITSIPAANIVVTEGEMDQAYEINGGVIQRQITINSSDLFEVNLYAHWSAGKKWFVRYSKPGIVRQDDSREFIYDGPPGPQH